MAKCMCGMFSGRPEEVTSRFGVDLENGNRHDVDGCRIVTMGHSAPGKVSCGKYAPKPDGGVASMNGRSYSDIALDASLAKAEAEQRAYRAGWEAGIRSGKPPLGPVPARFLPPIDLQRMAYESRASSDHQASREHAERELWHAGLSDDEEA